MTKQCTKCKETLPAGQFSKHKRTKDGLQSWCRSCNGRHCDLERKAQRNREHYADNSTAYKQRASTSYERMMEIIRNAKNHPCVDCGIQLPSECMDLDHTRRKAIHHRSMAASESSERGEPRRTSSCRNRKMRS